MSEVKKKRSEGRPCVLNKRRLISLNIESIKKRELEKIAKRTGRMQADLLREGVDMILAKYGN